MIQIAERKIMEAAEKGMDEFLKVFTDAYLETVGGDITAENMEKLNGYQHTLLALRFFSEEVNQGGFVQLIQNGYGGYIDRKSTRLNSSHVRISYAVFCLKKKKKIM